MHGGNRDQRSDDRTRRTDGELDGDLAVQVGVAGQFALVAVADLARIAGHDARDDRLVQRALNGRVAGADVDVAAAALQTARAADAVLGGPAVTAAASSSGAETADAQRRTAAAHADAAQA